MARKLTGLQRVLDVPSLAAVAYGEIASSLYFALGIVALFALGLTPWVLLATGVLFALVVLSYAEGTAMFPETGGAATFVRRAFNDPAGFFTGWALLLDYLIVIALAALFVAHYVGKTWGLDGLTKRPWDVAVGAGVIVVIAAVRLVHRPRLYGVAIVVAGAAFAAHLLLVVLGFALTFSFGDLGEGVSLGTAPTWHSLAFALPLAMLAYTGLETVANLAAETREPGRTLPRSLFAGVGLSVVMSVLVGIVGIAAYPSHHVRGGEATDLGNAWLRAPLVGIANAFGGSLPTWAFDAVKAFVAVSGVLVLVAAVSTSMSGAGRLSYSLGRHDMLPHAFARLSRRTLIPPVAILSSAALAAALLVVTAAIGREVRFLASLYSFGVLIAFTAAQVAVLRLRFTHRDYPRPFIARGSVGWRGVRLPLAALVGAPLTLAVWIAALATHRPTLIAGPVWILLGAVVFVAVRRARQEGLAQHVEPVPADIVPEVEGDYRRILVPLKLGPIGEDVLGTAIKVAEEQRCGVSVVHVIPVPLELPEDAPLPDKEERAAASLEQARELAREHGVEIETKVVRHRELGPAIVEEAKAGDIDLIVMGSSPRWRRFSAFVSPTVDYVLRRAPSEVLVVAYPEGYLDEDGAG